jgi:uncharacterized protein
VWSFRGKRILITGASSGIGEEFARQLALCADYLLLVARREDRLKELSKVLSSETCNVDYLVADLSTDEGINRVKSAIESQTIDCLVNNAGRGSFGEFEALSYEEEVEMLNLNVKAQLVLCHAIIPQLKVRKHGALIIISSVAGFQPLPFMATYAATKAFNYSHGIALENELRPYGIKVLTVCPGPVQTEFGGVARIPGEVTNINRDSVQNVVKESLRSVEKGGGVLVPCLQAKVLVFLGSLIPVRLSTRLLGRALKKSLLIKNLKR